MTVDECERGPVLSDLRTKFFSFSLQPSRHLETFNEDPEVARHECTQSSLHETSQSTESTHSYEISPD